MSSVVDKKLALLALMSLPVVDRLDALKDMHEANDPKLERILDTLVEAIAAAIAEYESLGKTQSILVMP